MVVLFKWLVRFSTAALLLAIAAIALVYYLASRSLPDYSKTLTVPRLSSPVEIVRDNANVPHIFAANSGSDADVFFGLGYAHAQDRLWQMIIMRRTAQGRLSELLGSRTVEIDALLRRLELYPLATRSVGAQSAQTIEALEAYAAGVNARIVEINRDSLGRGAPEMFLFNAPIAPWRPADSIVLLKLMAVQLSGHIEEEVLRARTSIQLRDPARLKDILPDDPGSGIVALPDYASLMPPLPALSRQARAHNSLSPFARRGFSGASNAFAAAPHRSATNGTILANDPHLGFSAPTVWYLARLELQTGGVIGGTIPGIPAILAGRSEQLGWGLTTTYLDDQDIYIEEVNPNNPGQYRIPDGWADFETRRTIINIKDADPVTLTLRRTENGIVMTGNDFNLGDITPTGHVAALAWTALSDRDTSITAAQDIMRAQTVEQALAATSDYIAPAQNLTVVDRNRIALKVIGAMPRRDPDHQTQGRMPSLGALSQNRWLGTFPDSFNPVFIDPEGGILGNTNNKLLDRPFPLHVTHRWGDTQRIHRWKRLIQTRRVHTRDSFIEAQLDTVSFSARSLLPLIGANLWFTGESAPTGTPARLRQDALALLADWNGEMNEHLPEPLLYAAWVRALQKRLIQDDLGTLADEFTNVDPLFLERVYRDVDGASAWCDIRQSVRIETCADIARLALDDALVWIGDTYGTRLESLRWGDAHQATHDHQILGEVPILSGIANIRQSTSGGDNTLLRGLTSGKDPEPFQNVHGAGYRGVYDFADPDSSVFITSTGQSGHFLSRHYEDLGDLWRRGEYIPMSLDADLARAAAVGITTLVPEENAQR